MQVPLRTTMERGNKKKNKRGRGSEGPGGCGDHQYHMENIWRSKSKYEDEPRWCMDCLGSSCYINTKNGNSRYDICSEEQKVELGVFEFPWLKDEGEGVIFKGNDLCQAPAGMGLLDLEDKYAFALTALHHHDHLHHFATTTTSSSFQIDNLCSSSPLPVPLPFHHADNPNKIFEGSPPRPLSSFKVDSNNIDQQQQMECIWSSVLDQPLDINLNII